MKIRGNDQHGSGAYKASRGSRLHNGIDICCEQGDDVQALSDGRVTKIGYPYAQGPDADQDKAALRYVQVSDREGIDVRYFYVAPTVQVGDTILAGDELGSAQGLGHIYEGITEHYHFEVLMLINGHKVFLDPEQYANAQV